MAGLLRMAKWTNMHQTDAWASRALFVGGLSTVGLQATHLPPWALVLTCKEVGLGAGDGGQLYSTCLASANPWAGSPVSTLPS